MVLIIDVSDGLEDKIMKMTFLLITVLLLEKIGEEKSSFMLV